MQLIFYQPLFVLIQNEDQIYFLYHENEWNCCALYKCLYVLYVYVCVLSRSDRSVVDVPESCVFDMDVIRSALSQHNIDTSSLAISLVHRKLSIGLFVDIGWSLWCDNVNLV